MVEGSGTLKLQAQEQFYKHYHRPILAYIRNWKTKDPPEDVCQRFFLKLFADGKFVPDRDRGPLRPYLYTFLNNQLRNEVKSKLPPGHDPRDQAFDSATHSLESSGLSPDQAFDQTWALCLLERAVQHVRANCEKRGDGKLFERWIRYRRGDPTASSYAELARELQTTEVKIKTSFLRLRKAVREKFDTLVSDYVAGEDVEPEISYLKSLLARFGL